MNKQKAVQPLTLKYLNSYEAQMRAIKATSHLGWTPSVSDTPEDRSDMLPEVRKAIEEGRPF